MAKGPVRDMATAAMAINEATQNVLRRNFGRLRGHSCG